MNSRPIAKRSYKGKTGRAALKAAAADANAALLVIYELGYSDMSHSERDAITQARTICWDIEEGQP